MRKAFLILAVCVALFAVALFGSAAYGSVSQDATEANTEVLGLAQDQALAVSERSAEAAALLTRRDASGQSSASINAGKVVVDGSASGGTAVVGIPITERTDIDQLRALWAPRYAAAEDALVRFESAINVARQRGHLYLEEQTAITASIGDPNIRRSYEADDAEDRVLFAVWEGQADVALVHARSVVAKMRDVDLVMQKLDLRSEFVFENDAALALPLEVQALDRDIGDFWQATENIRAATVSPFER